ncbi:hypothetical protein KFK09_019323 [Dendrobium nobile]|uniref:Uncharacterized protein n=1 Tax=Dendrobium nobile TaxID=94219 RepID=A0A8T3B3N5_DENNO|nr:hypothetical protein KFK09_019323 [Dendrobium nobile]
MLPCQLIVTRLQPSMFRTYGHTHCRMKLRPLTARRSRALPTPGRTDAEHITFSSFQLKVSSRPPQRGDWRRVDEIPQSVNDEESGLISEKRCLLHNREARAAA